MNDITLKDYIKEKFIDVEKTLNTIVKELRSLDDKLATQDKKLETTWNKTISIENRINAEKVKRIQNTKFREKIENYWSIIIFLFGGTLAGAILSIVNLIQLLLN